MDVTTNRSSDPQVIDVAEPLPASEPMGPTDTIGEQEVIEEAMRARFAAIRVANTAVSVSLVGVGIGMAIATTRGRRGRRTGGPAGGEHRRQGHVVHDRGEAARRPRHLAR